ncbi:CTQ-dependent lysine 6-oxidase LodA [Echinicola shivajiensis]|uniref:CTQ-dependent lysine 6-oxidase LodA n=1 Tax=Echinicola shivajiensis TaxID=1035916 RepID=UPI001BFCD010|nr:CTQ-dependent lysine 6-oxidase LodA [Echinicola shivajiensis]
MDFKISPSVGIARLGNSKGQFCLSPDTIGGLPYEADGQGNKLGPIKNFKDEFSQVRRQGQLFRILRSDGTELTANSPNVSSMEWTVHLANKKAAWYQYSELEGNLLYGEANSYKNRGVALRNAGKTTEADRQTLIIDPGPRTVSGPNQNIGFDKSAVPSGYPAQYPPENVSSGMPITTLGDLKTDNQGRLVVLGGFGNAGGNEPLTSYGGSDTWHDDISDGPVYCTVTFNDGSAPLSLQAWVIVGSPDFAPEIVNISTLSDSMFDVAVRSFDLVPSMYHNGAFDPTYVVNYQRDILPIIQRLGGYQWVANVQSMMAFTSNIFDFSDPSEANKANRENYFSYFRRPNDKSNPSPNQPQSQLFKENGTDFFPMMPLNSGSNSVSNETIVKFLALNDTQYFMLNQWAKGSFENNPNYEPFPVSELDQASVGNCVGLPMCPGIEVTWSVQNKNIYSAPFVIADQKGPGGYNQTGLTPSRDECEGGGCQPGDLTKRMACPWQADFFQCTVQPVNFTNLSFNKDSRTTVQEVSTSDTWTASGTSYSDRQKLTSSPVNEPLPPTYYSYWWPPQSPWDVLTGEITLEGQMQSHLPAGQQMNYARGINSFVQMVEHWSAMAFIRNTNSQDKGFPYFSETERTHELFSFKEVGIGQISGNGGDNETTIPVFFIEDDVKRIEQKGEKAKKLVSFLEERAFKKITVSGEGLGVPRSGTRIRR